MLSAFSGVAKGAVLPLVAVFSLEGPARVETVESRLAPVYQAVLPTGIAAILRARVTTTAGSPFMSLVSYTMPVWAVLFGVTLMGATPPRHLFVAPDVILVGRLLSQMRLGRRD